MYFILICLHVQQSICLSTSLSVYINSHQHSIIFAVCFALGLLVFLQKDNTGSFMSAKIEILETLFFPPENIRWINLCDCQTRGTLSIHISANLSIPLNFSHLLDFILFNFRQTLHKKFLAKCRDVETESMFPLFFLFNHQIFNLLSLSLTCCSLG